MTASSSRKQERGERANAEDFDAEEGELIKEENEQEEEIFDQVSFLWLNLCQVEVWCGYTIFNALIQICLHIGWRNIGNTGKDIQGLISALLRWIILLFNSYVGKWLSSLKSSFLVLHDIKWRILLSGVSFVFAIGRSSCIS